jgi:hypothetical protein
MSGKNSAELMSGKNSKGVPVVIVTPKWKVSELCQIVRGEVEREWLTSEQGSQIIKDGKAQMVYTPPPAKGKP